MEVDLELKIQCGLAIEVDNVGYVHPLTMRDIATLGYSKYNEYLSVLCFNMNDLKLDLETLENIRNNELNTFDIIIANCESNEDYKKIIIKALEEFLKEKVYYENNYKVFFIEDILLKRIIHRGNFEYIKTILRTQNCLDKKNEDSENPSDAKAREILEKRRIAREKLLKAKNGDSDSECLTMSDLVSILCSNGNGINPINVWDLNFYMFNDQFNRMKMLEDYRINIRSLLAGAKSEDINLKHWMSKIK